MLTEMKNILFFWQHNKNNNNRYTGQATAAPISTSTENPPSSIPTPPSPFKDIGSNVFRQGENGFKPVGANFKQLDTEFKPVTFNGQKRK